MLLPIISQDIRLSSILFHSSAQLYKHLSLCPAELESCARRLAAVGVEYLKIYPLAISEKVLKSIRCACACARLGECVCDKANQLPSSYNRFFVLNLSSYAELNVNPVQKHTYTPTLVHIHSYTWLIVFKLCFPVRSLCEINFDFVQSVAKF